MNDDQFKLNLDQDSISALQKKSVEIQEKMSHTQQKLAMLEIVGESGGGLVKVYMNGRYEAKKVLIDPSAMKQQLQILSDLISAAITDATHKVEGAVQSEMFNMIQGLGLPDFKDKEGSGTAGGMITK